MPEGTPTLMSHRSSDDYILMSKPRVIFVLGGPGSGKGTHCDQLRERFSLLHLSVGDILRDFLKTGSKEAEEISRRMKEGQMVPSQIVVEQLKKKILSIGTGRIVMVDGFPRNQENIDLWEQIVGEEIKVILLAYIEVRDEVMIQRLLNRGKTSGRLDDTEEVITKRLATFHSETEPVLIHYKRLYREGKTRVFVVNGELKLEDAQARFKKFFEHNRILE
ncbi:uncharacterized protein LOC116268007 [Nymphaea colorata]|uniref:adenylate kinase n=1 Tax=Nymphaea colorata TaxID=210225 RepID=A0A5K1HT41_9MAGN|nr:uncharacterized protein LOC116268007 [Nymphaea colorata]VVW88404.1 unnamed protein product [Nymphaea colorata]